MGYIEEYLAQCPEELLYLECIEQLQDDPEYQEYLEQCKDHARLYRGRKMFNKDHLRTEWIGTVQNGVWLVDVYEDREGNFWTDDRVKIGKWIITGMELVSGCKEQSNTYWMHTGIDSDWDKVQEEYGGIPPYWERLSEDGQEEENEDYSSNVA